jgi:hypothetical protein
MTLQANAPAFAGRTSIIPDQRRHKRVRLSLLGRFMRENREEFPCRCVNISVGGADVASVERPDVGERVVMYVDHLGGLEGTVERVFETGFCVSFSITTRRQQKLAAQLTWLLNQHEIGATEQRRPGHDRIKLDRKSITLTLADGTNAKCAALDVSISGAKLETETRPPVGTIVMVAKLRSKVVRHHDKGIGVEFVDIQEMNALRRYFG